MSIKTKESTLVVVVYNVVVDKRKAKRPKGGHQRGEGERDGEGRTKCCNNPVLELDDAGQVERSAEGVGSERRG